MRKLLTAGIAALLVAGLVAAADVTLVKFDKDTKELTVKEGDAVKSYKVTDKTKFIAVDKKTGATKALPYERALKGLTNPNAAGKLKFDISVKDGEVVEAKMPGREKK